MILSLIFLAICIGSAYVVHLDQKAQKEKRDFIVAASTLTIIATVISIIAGILSIVFTMYKFFDEWSW